MDDLIERLRNWKATYRGDGDETTIPLAAEAATRLAEVEAENFVLAAGVCVYPNGEGLLGDEHGNSYCSVERERLRLCERETDLMAKSNEVEAYVHELLARLAEVESERDGLRITLSETAEELVYFIDFARGQAEFEGDAEVGLAVVRNARAALGAKP